MLKSKKPPKRQPALIKEELKYVIYCRKSKEESNDGQKQSLLDQLRTCLDYAQQKNLRVAFHNDLTDNFFRDDSYQRRISECSGSYEQSILERAKGLFYIVEQKSAKTPNNRPMRNKLIELVKKWKINWILSYAPDRHARNLVESGELVQLIDQQYLDVQYTNFTFENNENGRMILWINFVISYNYSDVLSKNIERGKMGVIERGQADGKYKYGYFINEENYHEPDPQFFAVWKEAFRRKIYDYQTDEEITQYITSMGFKRKFKAGKRETKLNRKSLYRRRLDPFYYGILISGSNEIDLRDGANPYYQPLITEEEHLILLDRHLKKDPVSLRVCKTMEEYDDLKPFPNKFIQFDGKHGFIFELPNPKRHRKALAKLQLSKRDATLKDIVMPNQFNYKAHWLKIDWKQLAFRWDRLIKWVSEFLKENIKINEDNYEKYKEFYINEYDYTMKKVNEKRRELQLQSNHINSLMERSARNFNKMNNTDELQKKVYRQDIQRFQGQIDYLQQELSKISQNHRNAIFELDAFVMGINNMSQMYDESSYVRQRKITTLLFSNIIIMNENQVVFKAKPWLEGLFISENAAIGEDFEHIKTTISSLDFTVLKPIIQFSYLQNKSFFDENYNITHQQNILYGLNEAKESLAV